MDTNDVQYKYNDDPANKNTLFYVKITFLALGLYNVLTHQGATEKRYITLYNVFCLLGRV